MKTKTAEKKERVIPKMTGSASAHVKRFYANFPKSVRRMVQQAEHNAKYLEYGTMQYDVQVTADGKAFKPRKVTKQNESV